LILSTERKEITRVNFIPVGFAANKHRSELEMEVNPVQLSVLGVLFFVFLMIPTLANSLGDTLDTLPMRLAGVLLILGSVSYDKYVAIAVFLVVAALYIQRHQNQLTGVFASDNDKNLDPSETQGIMQFAMPRRPHAVQQLNPGGQADVDYDYQDFMPKDRTNEVDLYDIGGLDEKRALTTEPLGQAKAQDLFPMDQREAQAVMNSSRGGSWE